MMSQIILQLKDQNKLEYLMQLLSKLDFVEVVEPQSSVHEKAEVYQTGIKQALSEIEEHLAGNIKLQDAREFLEEL